MRRLRLVMAALLALVMFVGGGVAADSRLALKARVVDENGLPVGGAQVKLEAAGGQSFLAVSDDTGYFAIAGLPPGEYK
ncbi:MAG: carboxypeptidase-like regulatory domain-containing protein, partial [Candidatus Acidiferrum sp.]